MKDTKSTKVIIKSIRNLRGLRDLRGEISFVKCCNNFGKLQKLSAS
jgi:hypothetical protein